MHRDVRVIGAPTDYGADRRGVDMGPSAIRYAGLYDAIERLGVACTDDGNLDVPQLPRRPDGGPAPGTAKYLDETRAVSTALADHVDAALAAGERPLVLGGDHSVAIGSITGAARDSDLGVLWLDAHGDFNTPATTPSGNVHGMSLAAVLGQGEFADADWARAGIDPESVALVGVRDLDDGEREALRESDVSVFPISAIDEHGVVSVIEDALGVVTESTDGVHVSLDLDWLDPDEAPGVGTPVRGGVSYREAHSALETVAATLGADLRSLELVEVNPILDQHNRTAELAVELAASLLGKKVL
jgi:arginase